MTYKNSRVEKLCTDFKLANKKLGMRVSKSLFDLINLLESSLNLQDVNALMIYNLHELHGNMKGMFALDIGGRSSGYRLIISPRNITDFDKVNLVEFYNGITLIKVEEVSNHYE